jgi:ParB family chromosome partitioning protein
MQFFDPADVLIVDDPTDPLFDERHARSIEEADILNVLAFGVLQPVLAQRRGRVPVVIDGRQRVRWARLANERLRAQGQHPIKIPIVFRHVEDASEAISVAVSCNEIRDDDDVLTRARKAARLRSRGRTLKEIGLAFGVTDSCVKNWLSLLELPEGAQRAVVDGDVRMADAVGLRLLPAAQQAAALETLRRERPTKKARVDRGQSGSRSTSEQEYPTRPTTRLRRLAEIMASQPDAFPAAARVIVHWAMGTAPDSELVTAFPCCGALVQKKSHHGRHRHRDRPRSRAAKITTTDLPSPSTAPTDCGSQADESAVPFRALAPSSLEA